MNPYLKIAYDAGAEKATQDFSLASLLPKNEAAYLQSLTPEAEPETEATPLTPETLQRLSRLARIGRRAKHPSIQLAARLTPKAVTLLTQEDAPHEPTPETSV